MAANIDIDLFLKEVASFVRDKHVPVVDLIAIQTKDPFKVLVATILSARTKDETTAKAAERLFEVAETPDSLAKLTQSKIEKLIHPVGFFRNKAKYLKQLPISLQTFNGIVPDSIEELCTLPGVGRKTANLVRSVAFSKPAICVDTHVHRIMNIWEFVETDTPLKTEMALRKKLPEKYWITVNSILVAFGQSLCKPVSPHCDICPLQASCPQKNVKPRKTSKTIQKKTTSDTPTTLKLVSWNVNGIRAVEKKGFLEILDELECDVLAIQETKAQPEQLSNSLINPNGYHAYYHSAVKKGYSGVAVFTKQKPLDVQYGINIPEFDNEGRVITVEFETFYLINIYFPNAGQGLKRLDFKLQFNSALQEFAETLRQTKPVILCGDFNVAHKPIDLKNPDSNVKNAGYTPEERNWMDSFIDADYVDTFRMFNQEPEQYSWWSYRFNARARNIGWRIDYFCVHNTNEANVADADIYQHIMGSDHCPVVLEYIP